MKRNAFQFLALFCAALLCMSSVAHSSIIGGYLTYDGIEDGLTDESRASKTNPAAPLAAGDIIYGVVQITSVQASGLPNVFLPPQTIGAVFSATITGGNGSAASPFTLGATAQTGAGGFGLDALAPNLFADSIAAGTTAAQLANSIFLVGSNTNILNLMLEVGGSAKSSIIAAEAALTGAGGMYEATGGIAPGSNDFFEAVFGSGNRIEEFGGLTLFNYAFGGPLKLVPAVHANGSTTFHDLSLEGTIRPQTSGVYLFNDDVRFGVNVLPEPMSILVWGGIASIGSCVAIRSRRRNGAISMSK